MDFLLIQGLTGLASAASLFLVAAGLTVIFGVTRVVNFAHGSLFMLGAYLAWSILTRLPRDPGWFAGGVMLVALAAGLIGLVLETVLLRRLYRSDELFKLLATFGVVLIVQDLTPLLWGPAELPLPRPAWLRAFVTIGDARFPRYDLLLIAIGPVVLGLLWLLLNRTRFGMMIRAATEDRDMAAALGIDQRRLFSAVFFLGSALAGLAGALALPNASANLHMDLAVIVDAFVVVVVGGMGSVTGAFLASLLIGQLQAFGIVLIPQATLVLVFAMMAVMLVARPNGLLGAALPQIKGPAGVPALIRPASTAVTVVLAAVLGLAAAAPLVVQPYPLAVLTEALIAMLFAASLHLTMGPGGMPSFGHAAWFGLGAYGAALAAKALAAPLPLALLAAPVVAGVAAFILGLCVVRLSGVYLAMLTLAFAQIVWAVATQWRGLTGGDDGILGVWPDLPVRFYWVVLVLSAGGVWLLRRTQYAPFGFALRAVRDAPQRAAASGLAADRLRLAAFTLAGATAGLSGGLFAYAKGSVFPTYVAIERSVDALLMVLLGGVQTVSGPVLGAFGYTLLYDGLLQATSYWRLALGIAILVLVLAFPRGLAGMHYASKTPRTAGTGPMQREAAEATMAPCNEAPAGTEAGTARTPRSRGATLKAEGLCKDFGGIQAVADMSFMLQPGEIVALIGPNGAGKSTCFNLLTGQIRPDAGRIMLDGTDITGLPPARILHLGVGRSFQVAAVFGSMAVRENVQTALLARRRATWSFVRSAIGCHRAEADTLLQQVGLSQRADDAAATLAYGDVKRLELAIALAGAPRLLLVDEPTAGMAPAERGTLMALVRRLTHATGCTVLFTEHDMDVVFGIADCIMVMHRGRLIITGDAAMVRADPRVQAVYLGTA